MKTMKKRWLAGLLAALLLLSMAACGGAPQPDAAQAPADAPAGDEALPEGVVTMDAAKLRVLVQSNGTELFTLAEEWYPRYKEAFPNYEVEFDVQGETYADKLKIYCSSGDMPDIFNCFNSLPIDTGNALDLTPLIERDGWADRLKTPSAMIPYSDGGIYTLQEGRDSYFIPTIWYNKEIFAAAGVEVPETYEEFVSVCKALKAYGVIPCSMAATWPLELFHQMMVSTVDLEAMGRVIRKEGSWKDEAVVEGTRRFQELVELGVFPDNLVTIAWDAACELFNAGKAAMWMEPTWGYASITLDEDQFDFFLMPNDAGAKERVAWGSFAGGLSISADTEQQEAAWLLLQWMVEQEAVYFEQERNMSIAYDTGLETAEKSAVMQKNDAIVADAEYKTASTVLPFMNAEVTTEFNENLAKLESGQIDAAQFTDAMAAVWQ